MKVSPEDIEKETCKEPNSPSFTSLDNMVIHPLGNNELRTDILTYISGNTQRKVSGQIECESCLNYLRKDTNVTSCGLLELKDRGGLVRPCKDVVNLVKIVDNIVEIERKCTALSDPVFSTKNMTTKCLSYVSDMKPLLFTAICENPTHKVDIMKKVISYYLKVKIGHLCRLQNQNQKSNIRHIHKKMPINSHE